jgi:hypothetical protein
VLVLASFDLNLAPAPSYSFVFDPLLFSICYLLCARSALGFAILWLLLPASVSGQETPSLKAKIGEPVIEQLMGGCSLTCAFPWEAVVGGSQEMQAKKTAAINDSDASSAWMEARVGDKLVFRFPANLPRELNGTPFYGIDIANGRLHPEKEFQAFGRIKELRLYHNDRALYTISLADTRRWQEVTFDDVLLNVGDTLALEILALYPGRSASTGAITEIVLQGAH